MGVMACDRNKCDNIMCDNYSEEYGYICWECLSELKEGTQRSIQVFMGTPKKKEKCLMIQKHEKNLLNRYLNNMDTLIEFKNKYGIWLDDIRSWITKNTIPNNDKDSWTSNKPLVFNREIFVSDLEGIAAVIAYSVYKEFQEPEYIKESEPINEEHLLFISFLKKQGISAEFSHNLKAFRKMEINQYLETLDNRKIDMEYCIFMAFSWNPKTFKEMIENQLFWEYHSNIWKKKLNNFRG